MAGVADILPGYVWEALVPFHSNPLIHGIDCANQALGPVFKEKKRQQSFHNPGHLEVLLSLLSGLPS